MAPGVFGNQQQDHLDLIKSMLNAALVDTLHPSVQALAVKATSAFVLLHENEANIQKEFGDLLPNMLTVIIFQNLFFVEKLIFFYF